MSVFVMTNPFREQDPQYINSRHIRLSIPSNDSSELIALAKQLLSLIYLSGYRYKKAGVVITEITPSTPTQSDLFDPIDRNKRKDLLQAVDRLNDRMGSYKIRIASQGYGRKWKLKNERLSPCYTTRLEDVISIHCDAPV